MPKIQRENMALHSALAEAIRRLRTATRVDTDGIGPYPTEDLLRVLEDPDGALRGWEIQAKLVVVGMRLGPGWTPPDLERCQAELHSYHPFVMGGNPRRSERCANAPVTVVVETKDDADGYRGAMSLCAPCRGVLAKEQPDAEFLDVPLG